MGSSSLRRGVHSAEGVVRVEQVHLARRCDRPARAFLRVTEYGFFVADCRTVEEVARHVDLAALFQQP